MNAPLIREFLSRPVFVYFSEEAVAPRPVLFMVFFNGLSYAIDMIARFLDDAADGYLDDLTVTIIDEDLQDAIIGVGPEDPENWAMDDEPDPRDDSDHICATCGDPDCNRPEGHAIEEA